MKLKLPWLKIKKTLVEKRKQFHAANILGRTFEEVDIYDAFGSTAAPDRFYMLYFG
jgi:hypothetical protein